MVTLNILPPEILFQIWLDYFQNNGNNIYFISKELNNSILLDINHYIQSVMTIPLDLKINICNFLGRETSDNIDYLVGSFTILDTNNLNNTIENMTSELIPFNIKKDSQGNLRSYEEVIITDIYLGDEFGSHLIDIKTHYENHISFYKYENNVISINGNKMNHSSKKLSHIYWLYIVEKKTNVFTYILLPYYNKYYNNHTIIKIYDIIPNKSMDIMDLYLI